MKTPQPFMLLILAVTSLAQEVCYSQVQQIQLLNGKNIPVENYQIGPDFITYKKPGDKPKRTRSVDRYDVFSITNASGGEDVVYAPMDSLDFTVDEARRFIQGEQAAFKYYQNDLNSFAAASIGLYSGLLQYYSFPVPMLVGIISGRFNPLKTSSRQKEGGSPHDAKREERLIRKMNLPDSFGPELSSAPEFRMGYDKAARNMKIQTSLKWGYIGLGASLGMLIYYAHLND